ncbi:ACP S-malonyltransferase [Dethiosulfovibrio salsuginis]|uniref:Malonyl CoA-acyl carrier protein transacylase n=1 Tax=Dethiosulfovibrio salsuginis TaxID=561720 RepID=A0A1X7IAQ2_9BACT|nr:ACP S-malonyltransferase [Dethiosulfovibrio salsuginis]SMG11123.1 [Acyl-carrier-protein] S-malonyltransferase [Dethiosulfovibrio salsuginis]
MGYALLFPGQGAQFVGMAKDLYDGYPSAREVFDEADRALGFSLTSITFDGPEEKLKLTAYTQPAILAASVAVFDVLRKDIGVDFAPAFVAGHSLGEYSALVASGTLSLADGVRLVHARGKLMQEAVPEGEGAMAAVLGLDDSSVEEICRSCDGDMVCEAANFNSPGQVVISGHDEAIKKAVELLKAKGAKRAVSLNVSAPFHCRLMAPVADQLLEEMDRCSWSDSRWPLVANVSASSASTVKDIRDGLYRQTYSPVRWVESVRFMVESGVSSFLELGPGNVLAGLAKKCSKGVKTLSVGSSADLERAVDFLKEDQ